MGRHSTEPLGHHLPGASRWRGAAGVTLALGLVSALVAALVLVPRVLRGDLPREGAPSSVRTSPGCSGSTPLKVVVDPQILAAVMAAASRSARGGACAEYDVRPSAPAAAARSIANAAAPDVWVPDSTSWVDQLNADQPREAWRPTRSLATSPVVIALPAKLAETLEGVTPSWATLVSGTVPLRVTDPEQEAASRLALFAARAALGDSARGRAQASRAMARLARTTAEDQAALFAAYARTPSEAAAFPASEQSVAAFNETHRQAPLAAVVPREGTATLDYPWVPAPGLSGARLAQAEKLLAQLTDAGGSDMLRRSGFRAADRAGGPAVRGLPPGPVKQAPQLSVAQSAAALQLWRAAGTEMRMTLVIDVSGSMRRPAGEQTRIELAYDAALTALETLPPASEVGLWEFASDRGGRGTDWRELAPIRRLDATVGTTRQRDLLAQRFRELTKTVRGDTGLYDSLLAALRALRSGHRQGYAHSVVVLTDGINDDRSGISLPNLLATLKREQDPERPVRLVLVGMGPQADARSLRTVAEAAGGAAYLARDPKDITTVFVEALLSRG